MFRRKPPAAGMLPNGRAAGEAGPAVARELVEVYLRQVCLNDHVCLREALRRLERDIILYVLEETNGNQHQAAEALGIKPTTLNYRLHRLGIVPVHHYGLQDHLGLH